MSVSKLRGDEILLRVAFFLFCFAATSQALASQDVDQINMVELGKQVYQTGGESCRSCHGADGKGTNRARVSLAEPESWKSMKLQMALQGSDISVDSDEVLKDLILEGARNWNQANFGGLKSHLTESVVGQHFGDNGLPFDEDMVGLDGPNKKVLARNVMRMFRAQGLPRPTSKEIDNVLTSAVLLFIEEEFVE